MTKNVTRLEINMDNPKINLSSAHVLQTLRLLMDGNFTMSEIIELLGPNENGLPYSNSLVSKYISTCRYCGIDIPKFNNKYYVSSIPFGMALSNEEINLLQILQETADKELTKKKRAIFTDFINKINQFSNKQIMRRQPDKDMDLFEMYESAISEMRYVKLITKTNCTYECSPISIIENKDKKFFKVSIDGKEKLLPLNKIIGIEVLPKLFKKSTNETNVVFKLKGGLAKRYSLRDNENILGYEEDAIIISNKCKSKDILLSRLLRYDSLCEILNPVEYREEMKSLINNMLKNYGE